MTDQELDQILQAVKSESAELPGSVAERVMARINAQSRRRRVALWATLAAAAAAFVVMVRLPAPQTMERLPFPVGIPPAAPELAFHIPRTPPPVLANAGYRRRVKVSPRPGPLEIRMQTDDPDVLIIWLVDGEQEQGEH